MLSRLRWKVEQSVRERGVLGTARFSARRLYQKAKPGYRSALAAARERDREFDRLYGVETSEPQPLGGLDIASPHKLSGVDYEAISPAKFEAAFDDAATPAEGRTFVDFGSGKGRALLLASLHPFERIVGVEFSPLLAETARRNLATFRHPGQVCRDIEVVVGDAADFAIPGGPLLLYFFNPFGPDVMARVADNLARSLDAEPRPVTLIYCTDAHQAVWSRVPGLVRTRTGEGYSIFRND